ncbi:unnamed protein product, partial [Effrenium voratum]
MVISAQKGREGLDSFQQLCSGLGVARCESSEAGFQLEAGVSRDRIAFKVLEVSYQGEDFQIFIGERSMWDSAYGWAYDARGDVASWPNGAYEENVAWKYPQDAYQTYWQADAEMPISSQLEAKTRAFQPKRPDISLNLGFDEEVRPQLPSGLLDDEDDVTEVPAARARPEAAWKLRVKVRPRMRHPLPPNQVQHPTLQAQFGVQAPQPGLQARAKSPPGLAPPKAPGTVQVSALAALWQPKAITLAPPVEVCPGITVGQVDVWGMTCTRAEWRIEDVREKLQASMGRPLVSPPFAARGLPNLRLMVFPDAREVNLEGFCAYGAMKQHNPDLAESLGAKLEVCFYPGKGVLCILRRREEFAGYEARGYGHLVMKLLRLREARQSSSDADRAVWRLSSLSEEGRYLTRGRAAGLKERLARRHADASAMTVSEALLKAPDGTARRKHSESAEHSVNLGQIGRYGDTHVGSTNLPRCILNVLLSVLGAGQLTLPYAFSKLGLPRGLFFLLLFTFLSMHSLKTLSIYELHFTPQGCLESYSELVTRVLGSSGSLLCQFLLVFYAWGGAVAFLVILKAELGFLVHSHFSGKAMLCGIAFLLWRLSSCEDLTFLKKFSWLGCCVAITITIVMVVVSWPDLTLQNLSELYNDPPEPNLLDMAASLPLLSFSLNSSWAYIPVLCTLSEKSSANSLIFWSNFLIVLNYVALAASGYCTFGTDVRPNIMDSLGHIDGYWKSWMIWGAKVALCFQLTLALPLRFFVARKTIQDARPSLGESRARMALAFVLVFGATVTALPDISLAMVLGIVSGICASMIIYVLPAIIDLRVRHQGHCRCARLLASLVSLIVGLFILVGSLWANFMGAAKGVRQRERKGLYATMVKKGPVHASLKLKADCLLDATVLRFHLTVGNIRCGPFTYDYAECAVHGCEDFGIDWLKEIDDVESLRVGVEILDVVDSAECKAYARKAPDTAAKAADDQVHEIGTVLRQGSAFAPAEPWRALLLGCEPDVGAAAWLSEALDAKLEAARRLPAELVIDGAVARVLQSGPQEERSDFDCVLNFELLDTLSVKDFLPFCTATLGALRPGGLALFVSEESEAFGTLKRAMRQLRPLATERLVARSLNERLTLHIYRKAEETAPEAEAVPAKAAKAETASERPAGWGQWQKAWVQPARPVVDLAKMLRGDAPEALPEAEEAEVEAEEWLSDALQLVLLPGRGRGLALARPVEAGELLMVSKALFLAPADQIQPVAVSWLLEATVRQKQQFYSLFDGSNGDVLVPLDLYRPGGDAVEGLPVPERMDPERIYQILALNGLQADKLQAGKSLGTPSG